MSDNKKLTSKQVVEALKKEISPFFSCKSDAPIILPTLYDSVGDSKIYVSSSNYVCMGERTVWSRFEIIYGEADEKAKKQVEEF